MSKLDDVAKLAGVSRITVTRVVNGSVNVKESTKKAVLNAIAELNYRPNLLAKSLATNHSHTIGLVMSNISNPIYAEFVKGVSVCARRYNYDIIISISNDSDSMLASINTSINKMVDALLVLPADFHRSEDLTAEKHRARAQDVQDFYQGFRRLAEEIKQRNIPIAIYGFDIDIKDIGKTLEDYKTGAFMATEHLIKLGHRRIAYLGHILKESIWLDRFNGYLQALEKYGIEYDPALEMASADNIAAAYKVVSDYIHSNKELPTALFCANDEMGIGAVQAIRSCGFRVPEDISVIGHDGSAFSLWLVPNLTMISINPSLAGEMSVKRLIERIDHNEPPCITMMMPVLVEGGTTKTYKNSEDQ